MSIATRSVGGMGVPEGVHNTSSSSSQWRWRLSSSIREEERVEAVGKEESTLQGESVVGCSKGG